MNWKKLIEQSPPKQLWVEVNDYVLHAHQWHHSDAFTVVFIHGAIANNTWWQHIASQFNTGNILSIDLSGHGLSDWHNPYSLHQHALEVSKLVESYATGPVYIVGHSYGGAVAMLAKSMVSAKHIFMVDTPLYIVLEHQSPSSKPYNKYVFTTIEEAISRFKPIPNQPIEDTELLQSIAKSSIKKVENGYTWQFDPVFHCRKMTDEDQEIIQKNAEGMSYLYGEYSPFATEAALTNAKNLKMNLTKVPGSYHAVMIDAPKFLFEHLNNLTNN